MKKTYRSLVICLGLLFVFSVSFASGRPRAQGKLPVLTTSAGQSNDVTTVNIVLEEAGIGFDYCDVPDVDMMKPESGWPTRNPGPGSMPRCTPTWPNFPKDRLTAP